MILGKKFQQQIRLMVQDPVFNKPIQDKNYLNQGTITLVTKIKINKGG